ncbi:MAG: hypothetical protein J5802_09870 [Butyrivibrio sp.]|nr:hypothetical protein [Butyrivibrio sp.]
MLSVILIWLYVIVTTYLIGYGFISVVLAFSTHGNRSEKGRGKAYRVHFHDGYIMIGIVLVTVYAQVWSLFGGVSLNSHIFLILLSCISVVVFREKLIEDLRILLRIICSHKSGIAYFVTFMFMAYGTASGIMHYDSDLYHAQAIRWIEEYGVIKGLGNLHVRLAYNSASFPLSALYSMSFLEKQSYHVMSGFFAMILAWECVEIKSIVRRGYIIVSDFARLAAIYYLFGVFDEVVAPASDYFLSTLVFYIVIRWLDLYARHERSYVPYIFLSILSVFATTVKLSAAPLMLLSTIPIYRLMHNRTKHKIKVFFASVIGAISVAFPFFVRNVVISGWLLYPVTALDFFNVEWKIPKGVAQYDALEIKTFGRGFTDVATYANMPFSGWFPKWYSDLSSFNKLLIILDLAAILVYIAFSINYIIMVVKSGTFDTKKNTGKVFDINQRSMLRKGDFFAIGGTMIACFVFWLVSAPLIRYGIVYVLLTAAVICGRCVTMIQSGLNNQKKELVCKVFVALMILWTAYKAVHLVAEAEKRFNEAYMVNQQDYGKYEVKSYSINGVTFYYPTEGDRVGYDPFPASTEDLTGKLEFMGTKLEDGFKNSSEK